ncbi:MAG: Sialic acid TRAP transporter permease protein SiaT [Syntrophorhabdus sp. PtaU1.Bin058]|nr:MAG: Sialic acid TRAP transporter permease protein SiaT [Syntrophorhabdus sp. PtaU1.Bin058]
MNPFVIGLIFIGILLILLFLRMPVGLAMALIGFIGFAFITNLGGAYGQLRIVPMSIAANYDLCVIPLFMLMGSLAYHSGLSHDLYCGAYKCVGDLPGGLAIATILGCCGFAAVCGSTLATAATMGMVALPEMKKYNYDPALATGTVSSGGSLGILIPPSSIFIIYGILTEQSISRLFISGIFPGILLASLFITVICVQVKINPKLGPPSERIPFIEKLRAIKYMWPVLTLFLVIMSGLYMGVFTATEAAGVGAFGALLAGLIKKRFTRQNLIAALLETMRSTAMIFVVVIGAMIFGYFLTASRFTTELANFIAGFNLSRYVIFAGIIAVYMILGCLMDTLAMVILTVPIFYPLIVKMGFDPIWFGVVMVLVTEMGVITPPVGMNVYVVHGIAKDVPMFTIFRGAMPFFIMMMLCVVLLTIFPQITTFLPNLMGG